MKNDVHIAKYGFKKYIEPIVEKYTRSEGKL